jgi:hypothetical protein
VRKRLENFLATAALLLAVGSFAGCSDNSSPEAQPEANSQPENQTPQVDADPTPDTGTGGNSQTKSPDGTVNSAQAEQ